MNVSRLQRIAFLFPNTSAEASAFFEAVALLFAQVPGATAQADQVILTPTNPPMALPVTSLYSVEVGFPQIVFETEQLIDLHIGPLHLYSSIVTNQSAVPSSVATLQTNKLLSAGELYYRLHGHITQVDHTGVNIPTTALDRVGWDRLLQQLGAISALYKYPGEDWPFILPTTQEEFQSDIQHFVAGREPKFELVYDVWASQPVLQFSVATDFTRAGVEALFPEPYGVAFPDLGDIFRTVYLAHPWPNLIIRFDLNYRSEGVVSDWDTGEWLITQGGRIR